MNWDALGAIGELIGALAVLATLGYLSVQLRQNTQGMKASVRLDIGKQFASYTDLLLNQPELLELQLKGLSQQDLTEIEQVRFSLLMQRATWHFSAMHHQCRTQSASEDEWYESDRLIRWFTFSPGYRSWWKKNSINYSLEFRSYLDKHIKSNDLEPQRLR